MTLSREVIIFYACDLKLTAPLRTRSTHDKIAVKSSCKFLTSLRSKRFRAV